MNRRILLISARCGVGGENRKATSAIGRYCCKSRFSPMTKILRAVGATFAYKMRGTSRPHAKFTGDFGNAIEVIQISDRSLLSVSRKILSPATFDLQHNRPLADIHPSIVDVCF